MGWDYTQIWNDLQEWRWQEWASTVTQIASVYYARKNNVWVYPTGIIGVLLAAYVYFFLVDPPLYADGGLNLYYFLMSVYGWRQWARKSADESLTFPIRWCTQGERLGGFALFGVSWGVLYGILVWATNSNTPVLDSLVSSTAITAMWWMATRKIENWMAWIVSNLVAIPLNLYKGLPVFTGMYVLFLVMAVQGYLDWRRAVQTKEPATSI